ncbi:nicotinate-nucleotide--dimethylbenzimidazole phosphoribosyltransferase [Lamprobacter modestohalophilus]|uniref:nicotinate-nucleotide--dimethylbenzimidazole phosphoribosyltransferase n=1 Tax=Lamprobacter modestohalophilus TaxID=1064514 RepID=UPI002ADEDA5F|nr:nicotinate-nucleotide--dimethylbenzimidazole phosphoribosyltransferase [Lamprobacter modestohalophilus]MEA1049073.1 nicotinate-nucleotide--dimethylbenzimidazole phosphoribosyltransferase [Lamprobacter modestohalophilus]
MNPTVDWLRAPAAAVDLESREAAISRQGELTKPPGSLGRLEDIAIQLAALQGRERPALEQVQIVVFAGDHGVAAAGVSAFPQAVTAQMIANMASGGAAISVLARQIGAGIELVNLGTVAPVAAHPLIRDAVIAAGTANLAEAPAMSVAQLAQALAEGAAAVERARAAGAELFIAGEMGIGNTTAATALTCALLGLPAADLVGPGTGLDRSGIERKRVLIDQALALHRDAFADLSVAPIKALAHLGGFEVAAMAGAYVACAQQGLPMLVDGFISTAAALVASRLCPGAVDWMLLAHMSAEPGHRAMVEAIGLRPLLDLGMRLGEGSGAAAAVPLLRLACALHAQMATFAEAGVAAKAS